jgi:hypothetical protein
MTSSRQVFEKNLETLFTQLEDVVKQMPSDQQHAEHRRLVLFQLEATQLIKTIDFDRSDLASPERELAKIFNRYKKYYEENALNHSPIYNLLSQHQLPIMTLTDETPEEMPVETVPSSRRYSLFHSQEEHKEMLAEFSNWAKLSENLGSYIEKQRIDNVDDAAILIEQAEELLPELMEKLQVILVDSRDVARFDVLLKNVFELAKNYLKKHPEERKAKFGLDLVKTALDVCETAEQTGDVKKAFLNLWECVERLRREAKQLYKGSHNVFARALLPSSGTLTYFKDETKRILKKDTLRVFAEECRKERAVSPSTSHSSTSTGSSGS